MPNKAIVAIICITILLSIALLKGIDGALLIGGTNVIAGLAGYAIGKKSSP